MKPAKMLEQVIHALPNSREKLYIPSDILSKVTYSKVETDLLQ